MNPFDTDVQTSEAILLIRAIESLPSQRISFYPLATLEPVIQTQRSRHPAPGHWHGPRKILVEVKSFIGRSFIADLQRAIGQYAMYQTIIEEQGLEFRLYMAIPSTVYAERFQFPLAQLMLERGGINLLVFDIKQEVVDQWIELTNIDR